VARFGNLPRNAVLVVLQAIVNGVALFILYWYLLELLGADQVGLWSVVLATASASRLSEFGFAGGATKFIAQAIAHGDSGRATVMIKTAFTSVSVALGAVVIIIYPLAKAVLALVVPAEVHSQAVSLIPYAIASVWLSGMSSVLMASLDGCHRADIRAVLSMVSSFAYLGLIFLLAPMYGIVGLGLAQLGQAAFLTLFGWIILRSQIGASSLTPIGWSRKEFLGMLGYSVNFQLISMLQMLSEPLRKMLIAKFGGLGATAYFDMANRMILQFRGLIVAVNKVLVPRIATVKELDPGSLSTTYINMCRWTVFITMPLYGGISWAIPVIGMLWIGSEAGPFCVFAFLLLFGYAINTISSPAYFMNIGSGDLRWNVYSHLLLAGMTVFVGIPLGLGYGAVGVVLAAVLALSAASVLTIVAYHRMHALPVSALMAPDLRSFLLVMAVLILAGGAAAYLTDVGAVAIGEGMIVLAVGSTLVLLASWFSPMRSEVLEQLRRLRPRQQH
jgi:O-antigen/teichoic acid export membrane protein